MTSAESFLLALSTVLWAVPVEERAPEEQVFVLIWELEAEVNNGGFHQFYFNSAGDHALATATALSVIGASHTADIVRSANAVFPEAPSPRQSERQKQLEALAGGEAAFEALDDRFYEYRDDLSALLYTYVQAHRDQFRDVE